MATIFAVTIGLATTVRAQQAAANPWTAAQITQPGQLAAKLSKGAKPVILQVGFQVLYKSKHIPGSIYAGPASTPEGLNALKQAARTLPEECGHLHLLRLLPDRQVPEYSSRICRPESHGLYHLHVVMLSTSFGKDWAAHAYPVAGESAPSQ